MLNDALRRARRQRSVLERMRPVLELLGANRFVLGKRAGMGQAAKLANQIMLTAALLGVAEGLTLARSFGLDAGTVLPIIGVSAGNSWAVQNWATARRWWEAYQPVPRSTSSSRICAPSRAAPEDAGLSLPVAAGVLERILGAWPPK